MSESKYSLYLTVLCIYICIVLLIFAILGQIYDYDYIGGGCVIGLFACILFFQGLRRELIPILRLFQIAFVILSAYFTGNFLIELVKWIGGEKEIRYIVFPVWILLIVPTALMVYLLHKHMDYLAETLPEMADA